MLQEASSGLNGNRGIHLFSVTQELSQLQGSHQALEQQLDQTRTKLTQEIQQSKKDLNVLQADMEKVTFPDHLLCGLPTPAS